MQTKHLVLSLSALAFSLVSASAATVFQIDLQQSGSPAGQETQAGWTAWDVDKVQTNNSITTTVAGIGITINTNGGGWVSSRGGSADDRGGDITGTSWNDMAEDFAVSRGGNDSATLALTNLSSALTYTLTVHNNESYVINAGFSGGTITPSITTGTLVGAADTGVITNVQPGARTDGDFDQTVISFTPDVSGNASILYSSTTDFVLFNGLELTSVPEPSTGLLAALAGLGLIIRRRR